MEATFKLKIFCSLVIFGDPIEKYKSNWGSFPQFPASEKKTSLKPPPVRLDLHKKRCLQHPYNSSPCAVSLGEKNRYIYIYI